MGFSEGESEERCWWSCGERRVVRGGEGSRSCSRIGVSEEGEGE